MRCAVVADIHSNLEAFRAVLKDLEARGGADQMWCLGDVVGYGPDPHECVHVLSRHPGVAVAGNHDWAAVGKLEASRLNAEAAAVSRWTAAPAEPAEHGLVNRRSCVLKLGVETMTEEALSLEELALRYLTSLPAEERADKQQEVNKFTLWYGKGRSVTLITPTELETYAQWTAASTGDANKKLEPVRALLQYARKEKLLRTSLAPHLRIKQVQGRKGTRRQPRQTPVALTANDHAELKAQLQALEEERVRVAEEMRVAAADKDFRENAPLHAARERAAHIEAKMNDIQASLATGIVVDAEAQPETLAAKLGSTVALVAMASGDKLTYTLATKNEANPANGKISIDSPLGKAVLNQHQGDVIKVVAPAGEILYKIEKIE